MMKNDIDMAQEEVMKFQGLVDRLLPELKELYERHKDEASFLDYLTILVQFIAMGCAAAETEVQARQTAQMMAEGILMTMPRYRSALRVEGAHA